MEKLDKNLTSRAGVLGKYLKNKSNKISRENILKDLREKEDREV